MKPGDFVEARRRLEAKARAGGEKLTSLSEAAGWIKDGDSIAIGGCCYSRTPLALLMEVLRQKRRGLTLSRNLMCFEGEWFIAAQAVETLVTSWFGIGLPWGLSRVLREAVEGGHLRFEEWSHLGLGLRYRAGAMGVPFLPTLTMLGSDLIGVADAKTMTCPFTGETVCLIPALFPDVAVLHVHRADSLGNCQIDGYPHMDVDVALAATTVLVTAEEIVSEEEIRRRPDRTVIPGFAVDAVVEVPYGAFPHECYGLYEADFNHFDQYVAQGSSQGAGGVREYLDRWVYQTPNHEDYLDLFGADTLDRLARSARALVGGA
jgi:glutaconate CoA-transferase subunit A